VGPRAGLDRCGKSRVKINILSKEKLIMCAKKINYPRLKVSKFFIYFLFIVYFYILM